MMVKYTHEHVFLRRYRGAQQGVWQLRKEKPHTDRFLSRRFTSGVCGHYHEGSKRSWLSKKKKALLALTILGLSLSLTGCMGIYEGGFECPPGEGTKCKSISEVNDLVNKGEIPKKPFIAPPETCTFCSSSENNEENNLHQQQAQQGPIIWWAPGSHQWPVINYQNGPVEKQRINQKQVKEVETNVESSI